MSYVDVILNSSRLSVGDVIEASLGIVRMKLPAYRPPFDGRGCVGAPVRALDNETVAITTRDDPDKLGYIIAVPDAFEQQRIDAERFHKRAVESAR